MLEQFLVNLQSVNRHLRTGALQYGNQQITRVQWMVLRYVNRVDGCTIGSLVERFGVGHSSISQTLNRLEKYHWIVRTTAATDARMKVVRLTEHGKHLMQEVESLWLSRLASAFASFSAPDQEQLAQLFARLAQALDEPDLQSVTSYESEKTDL